MSIDGIDIFAQVLTIMQGNRSRLLGGDNQDIRLGQLLQEMKDLVKDRFTKETLRKD